MGNSSYSYSSRTLRSEAKGFYKKSMDEVFTQQKERKIHESMSPKGVKKREAFDSPTHPNTVPIILNLDVTGSMMTIPDFLVKDGLPKMMGGLIQNGIPDASLLFTAIGDHECDRFPLQIGQFESGDEELDLWLTRTYLEKGGGSNAGESYLLAHYFAAFHTDIDSFKKRGQRGFLFTVGDEPGLRTLPGRAIDEIMGTTGSKTWTDRELLAEAEKMYDVYHIILEHSEGAKRSLAYWKGLLGQKCIVVKDPADVAKTITEIVVKNTTGNIARELNIVDGEIHIPDAPKPDIEIPNML
jgi:hypothetical protein